MDALGPYSPLPAHVALKRGTLNTDGALPTAYNRHCRIQLGCPPWVSIIVPHALRPSLHQLRSLIRNMQHADLTTSPPATRRPALTAGLLLAGGLLLFILLAYSGFRSLQTVEHEALMRSRANSGLLHAGTVLSALKDVETGQRGYVLTGDEHYLGPFLAGRDALEPAFTALRSVAAPLHTTDLDALWALVLGRVELAQRNVDARRAEGAYTERFRALLDQGRTVMDDIRTRFDEVDASLRQEVVRRDKHLFKLKHSALMWAVVLTASGVVLIVIAYVLLQREQARRRRAEAALIDANTHLEDTVAARTAALERARAEIKSFAHNLDRSIETERRRLAREVHDQLGQVLTALKMNAHRSLAGVDGGAETLGQIDALVAEGIATVRRIAAALRPPLLDDLGLGPALTLAGRQFGEHAGVNCTVEVNDTACLNPEQATQLYRITQEALTNIARHAGARRVWIAGEVAHETEGSTYHLAIEDDGRGMAPSGTPKNTVSLGLVSMRERASLVGGSLQISRGRDGGVRVEISLPLADSKEDATCAS